MSTVTRTGAVAPAHRPPADGGKRRLGLPQVLLLVAGGLLLLSAVRALTDTTNLTASAQIGGALALAVPIGLAGLGGLWAERSGVINIGLEGMMILGTFFAGWIGWQHGPWAGALAGVIGGALGGLVHAMATVTFGVDHIVSGVAINILALGTTQYLAKIFFADGDALAAGGTDKQSPQVDDMHAFSVPGLSDWLGDLEEKHWFFVSDTAGILGGLTNDVSYLILVAAALFVLTYYVLWRSAFGLRLRSCGENPVAAESLGVNVYLYKYAALAVSGALAGLGGAFLVTFTHIYLEGQTGGRGYIGLASMIFGNWRPGGTAMAAGLFGFTDSLQLRGGGEAVHALFLLLAVLLAAYAVWKYVRGGTRAAIAAGVSAVLLGALYATTDTVPREVVEATPYVTTLVVLAVFAQRLRVPKWIGKRYRRGEST
ncbi:ABC transporter permease [Streptomyces phytophilus]|uniref:ABC transporter permease n=1 Tax=Streptomyces phytophilus TaxID=722715 RepID=UPI0015F080FF|nr:ABC transporter permease [Streptomyces phytophilus]